MCLVPYEPKVERGLGPLLKTDCKLGLNQAPPCRVLLASALHSRARLSTMPGRGCAAGHQPDGEMSG